MNPEVAGVLPGDLHAPSGHRLFEAEGGRAGLGAERRNFAGHDDFCVSAPIVCRPIAECGAW